jgi:hypothetical protein
MTDWFKWLKEAIRRANNAAQPQDQRVKQMIEEVKKEHAEHWQKKRQGGFRP